LPLYSRSFGPGCGAFCGPELTVACKTMLLHYWNRKLQ
jgi:hypothetical protein